MKTEQSTKKANAKTPKKATPEAHSIDQDVRTSWETIAPFWPLKTLNAVNPLRGLEHMSIEEALVAGDAYFRTADCPQEMLAVNRETMKWMQAYFDGGQATLAMPLRQQGLYACWKHLAAYDSRLTAEPANAAWLARLPDSPEEALEVCLRDLGVSQDESAHFLTLLLTTLPGWAAHVKYRINWDGSNDQHPIPVTGADYLAVRASICRLLWPQAKELLAWHEQNRAQAANQPSSMEEIEANESRFRPGLLQSVAAQIPHTTETKQTPKAQLMFCIDVRSEPFRRSLEQQGDYETLGFAGFFGVPVRVNNDLTGESHPACPVLLSPAHNVFDTPVGDQGALARDKQGHAILSACRRWYQSVKYTFTTPFALVEILGLGAAGWMGLRSLFPSLATRLHRKASSVVRPALPLSVCIHDIPHADRCRYAEGALRLTGLTDNFAPLVVLCGHGSSTQNNAYKSALDCGACGGRHGSSNAQVLAAILNDPQVRQDLAQKEILIPQTTHFLAGQHDTTTDEVTLFCEPELQHDSKVRQLKRDLESARLENSARRSAKLGYKGSQEQRAKHASRRARDWAQVRPEWGLARNAAFIVAPRQLTQRLDLDGRCFLHSYDYQADPEGELLSVILTAPMVVAQWINSQYLFSTLDNIAYGGGSKVTKNITGKMGIMQGNSSDLMHGLPLQSVYQSDKSPYHELQRLMTVVYASREVLDRIIEKHSILQTLFGNGWVTLACIDPKEQRPYTLNRNLKWSPA